MLRLSLLSFGILLVLAPPSMQADTCSSISELSNLELVAAMPAEAEAALIVRVHELDSPGSLLAHWVQYLGDPEAESDLGYDGEPDLSLMVENATARAGLHTIVWAGSQFVEPVGIGASRFDMRKVYITETGLEPLQEVLEAAAARSPLIESGSTGDLRYFKMPLTKQSGSDGVEVPGEYLVSFLDPCTVVLAETAEEIASITRALQDPDRSGSLVAVASGVADDAPVFLVRKVKPPLKDEGEKRITETRDLALTAALPDPATPRFEISITTKMAENDALEYFREVVVAYLMSESDYELHLTPASRGYQGYFEIKPDPNEPSFYLELVAFWFFGMWMTI